MIESPAIHVDCLCAERHTKAAAPFSVVTLALYETIPPRNESLLQCQKQRNADVNHPHASIPITSTQSPRVLLTAFPISATTGQSRLQNNVLSSSLLTSLSLSLLLPGAVDRA